MCEHTKDLTEIKVAVAEIRSDVKNGFRNGERHFKRLNSGVESNTKRIRFLERVAWVAMGAGVVGGFGGVEKLISIVS